MNDNVNTKLNNIDVNDSDFYDNLGRELQNDMARLKRNIDTSSNVKLAVAEIEVETAVQYHAEVFKFIEELKSLEETISSNVSKNQNSK